MVDLPAIFHEAKHVATYFMGRINPFSQAFPIPSCSETAAPAVPNCSHWMTGWPRGCAGCNAGTGCGGRPLGRRPRCLGPWGIMGAMGKIGRIFTQWIEGCHLFRFAILHHSTMMQKTCVFLQDESSRWHEQERSFQLNTCISLDSMQTRFNALALELFWPKNFADWFMRP